MNATRVTQLHAVSPITMQALVFSSFCVLLLLVATPTILAHPVQKGAGSAIVVEFLEDKVQLTVDLGFGPNVSGKLMKTIDEDADGTVSKEEADAYLEANWEKIQNSVIVMLNGSPVRFQKTKSFAPQLPGEIAPLPFNLYYEVEINLEFATPRDRQRRVRLDIRNRVLRHPDLRRLASGPPLYFVPLVGQSPEVTFKFVESSYLMDMREYVATGPRLVMDFDYSGGEPADGWASLQGVKNRHSEVPDSGKDEDRTTEKKENKDPDNETKGKASPTRPTDQVSPEPELGDDANSIIGISGRKTPLTLTSRLIFAVFALSLGLGGSLTLSGPGSRRRLWSRTLAQGLAVLLLGSPVLLFLHTSAQSAPEASRVLGRLLGSSILLSLGVLGLLRPNGRRTKSPESPTSPSSLLFPTPAVVATAALSFWHASDTTFAALLLSGFLVGSALGQLRQSPTSLQTGHGRLQALTLLCCGIAFLVSSLGDGSREIALILDALAETLSGT